MRMLPTVALLLAFLPFAAAANVSGDPTAPPAPDWCNPNTPVYALPTSVSRQPDGKLTYSHCRLNEDCQHPACAPTCEEFYRDGLTSVTLNDFCLRLAALPAPPPTGPGQQLKLDNLCATICVP